MRSVIFSLTIHNHQPIGNFDSVLEDSYHHSYNPFFEIAERHPAVLFGAHFSGYLLQWLLREHPEYRETLLRMVKSGQLDLITGGFYEPMLSVIPPSDQLGQIKKLTDYLESEFGTSASGMWLAERVWDQPLAAVLHDANVRFTFLDDTHFLSAGLDPTDLNGYYLTEAQGKTLAIFPIQKSLRYTIPFKPVDETIKILRDAASEKGENIVCFADDGEKFGVWPSTYHSVYEEGWLEEFFQKLEENRSWIKTMHGADILASVKPKGRIYLPNSSYAEMQEWALPSANATSAFEEFTALLAEDHRWKPYLKFVRGGFWPNFFVKYPESNHIHKRMLEVSERIRSLRQDPANNKETLSRAEDHLYRSQCNDAYWHGVFGGIYLNNLRHAIFSELLASERELQSLAPHKIRSESSDFDRDGTISIKIETGMLTAILAPEKGGALIEFDHMPRSFNANNILNRRTEAYHAKLRELNSPVNAGEPKSIHDMVRTKEEGLEAHLIADWYAHGSFLEHFFPPELSLETFQSTHFEERGDFLQNAFEHRSEGNDRIHKVELVRDGLVWENGKSYSVRLKKSISFELEQNEIDIAYKISNKSSKTLAFKFGSEWICNFLAGNAHDRFYEADGKQIAPPQLNVAGVIPAATTVRIVDEWMKLAFRIECDAATEFWRTPIETVSLSEAGFERVYQGSILMPLWQMQLEPGATWKTKFKVGFDELKE